jgi:hypothetical protein
MSNEIKVGDWTITEAGIKQLESIHTNAEYMRRRVNEMAIQCCAIIGIDNHPENSVARDIAEEIVMHGTPVDEVIARLQRHLAEPHSGDFS